MTKLDRRKYAVWHDCALRAELVVGQEDIVAAIEAILFERDPIGINFETNTDEYRQEAQCIVIGLAAAQNEATRTRLCTTSSRTGSRLLMPGHGLDTTR